MLIDIVLFDKYQNENVLKELTKVDFKVIKKQPCFSRLIRLRKRYDEVFTYHIHDYPTNTLRYSFGTVLTIDITQEDYEWLDYIMAARGYKKYDYLSIFLFNTLYQDFINHSYEVIGKSKAICYTATKEQRFVTTHENRHAVIDFDKSFLLNILN